MFLYYMNSLDIDVLYRKENSYCTLVLSGKVRT